MQVAGNPASFFFALAVYRVKGLKSHLFRPTPSLIPPFFISPPILSRAPLLLLQGLAGKYVFEPPPPEKTS